MRCTPGRNASSGDYRYGFNGYENDNEVSGTRNHLEFEGYGYDPRRVGRWNVDPKIKIFPSWSSYSYARNNPIIFSDIRGEKPKVEIIEDNNGNVTIKITNTLFVYNRGRKAKNTAMNAEDINSFLKGGTAKYKDKNVTLEINTQIVEVKNKREAIKNIEKNEGFGVVVKRDTRILFGSGNRSYHSFSEHNTSGVDEIVLVREDYNNSHTVAHETGHDLGFADKYVDNFNVGKSQATIPFKDGLMGGLDPLN